MSLTSISHPFVLDFFYTTWQCRKLQRFWQGICDALAIIHGVTFQMDPEDMPFGQHLKF